MVLVSQAIYRPVMGWYVNNELEMLWKEVVSTKFKLLYGQLLMRTGENYWKSYSG
jgi:hypothetical protein